MSLLRTALLDNIDVKYKIFSMKLVPDTNYPILGVRVPIIKSILKKHAQNNILNEFLLEKHVYYEEWFLHGLIISNEKKDLNKTFILLDDFLEYLDNWAICDSIALNLKIIKKHPKLSLDKIKFWLKSPNSYTVRFSIVLLLTFFMDENYNDEILSLVKNAFCENYYVNMAIAWAISIAVVKQPISAIKLLETKTLPKFIQNKSIQKSIESFRVSKELKTYLKTLKL